MTVQVVGPRSWHAQVLYNNVLSALARLGRREAVERVEDPAEIAAYGVIGAPALVVDGQVRVVGRVPAAGELERVLAPRDAA